MSEDDRDDDEKSRRSLPRRATRHKALKPAVSDVAAMKKSRKRKKDSSTSGDEAYDDRLSYRWVDRGSPQPNGSIHHSLLEVTIEGVTSVVTIGDTILLRSTSSGPTSDVEPDSDTTEESFVARIERMWGDPPGKTKRRAPKMKIRARWFFKKKDVEALGGNFTGPISRQQLLSTMTNKDLVLSNQTDDNDVWTILGKCAVILRRPTSQEDVPSLPTATFVSRYCIAFGGTSNSRTAVLTPYDGPNDEWPVPDEAGNDADETANEATLRATENVCQIPKGKTSSKRTIPKNNESALLSAAAKVEILKSEINPSSDTSSSEDDSGPSEGASVSSQEQRPPQTEGSITKGRIKVGPDHQVNVPTFTPGQHIPSRKPALVWKPNNISNEKHDDFLTRAAEILVVFLEQNGFLTEEPYYPLPSDKSERVLFCRGNLPSMTLSAISTASSLCRERNKLTRECNVDSILACLHDQEYNVQDALRVISTSPRDFLTLWTKTEKELFNTGFRRYSGSLRMIGKGASKNFKEVVDYHYRFKIPDQFLRYQEKKREQSWRMMECVEQRRFHDSIVISRDDPNGKRRKVSSGAYQGKPSARKTTDWHKTGVSDVIGAVEERRIAAKELLLQVQVALGAETMARLANAIKSYQDRPIGELKETFAELLREHPDLLERFMGFLPKRFRG